jgi:hypothetical protein
MQFANGGNLYEALTSTKNGRFNEKKTARYMKQLVECVPLRESTNPVFAASSNPTPLPAL